MGVTAKEANDTAGIVSSIGGMAAPVIQAGGQSLTALGPNSPLAPMFRSPAGLNSAGNTMNSIGNHMGGAMSVLGLGSGLYTMLDSTASTDDRIVGGGTAVSGALGTAGWMGSLFGASPTSFMGALGSVGGAAGLNAPAFAASTWGAGAAGGAGAAAGTALATGGAVLGAGMAGYGIGKYGDQMSKRYGMFGQNDDGENSSASDWAGDNGASVDSWVDEATGIDWLGDIAGGATVLGSSVAALPGVVGSALVGAGSAAVSFIGGIFSW